MKRMFVLISLITLVAGLAGVAQAEIPKPTANILGVFNTDLTNGLTLDALISLVTYLDNSSTNVDTAEETIIDASVALSGMVYQSTDASGNYLFSDGTFTISDASGTFMSADLVGVKVTPQGYVNPALSMNLKNIVFDTSLNSRFCQEFDNALQQAGLTEAGVKLTLDLWSGSFDSSGYGNASGLVDGAPTVIIVVEPRTIGFWKQQIDQKGNGSEKYTGGEIACLIEQALALDASYGSSGGDVFGSDGLLFRSDATSRGKRDMNIRARQQLAALLLNVVSERLAQDTPVSLPEYTTSTNVGEALVEVEQMINSGVAEDVETGKDIADFINNGVGIGQ